MRKSRQIPTFNLMVIGAQRTGKSTFLHTFIGSLTPSLPIKNDSPTISLPRTTSLSETSTSVVTLSGEKVMLNVIDTPGLDILSNDEFRVDLQVNETLRYIESKFDSSLQIERQVQRNPTRLGDGHVHVAIYFIHPSSIVRRNGAIGSTENALDSTGNVTLDTHELMHMSPIDLRQLKRLSRRCNVLPVIGRADELTEAELMNIKSVVQSDMKSYGIDLGLFAVVNESEELDTEGTSSDPPEVTTASSNSSKSNEEDETGKKLPRRRSTAFLAPRRPFSSVIESFQELDGVCGMIPLSVIGAESIPRKAMDAEDLERLNQVNPLVGDMEQPPSIYVRRFKWATVDVLNPRHCDFVLLRAVVLGSHYKRLKEATRLEKYEKYRTEKLLARRMTFHKGGLAQEEQRRIVMEVEKIEIPHIEPAVSIFVPPSPARPASTTGNIFKPSGWRKKHASPPLPASHVQQSAAYNHPHPTQDAFRYRSRSPQPENINNLPMVF